MLGIYGEERGEGEDPGEVVVYPAGSRDEGRFGDCEVSSFGGREECSRRGAWRMCGEFVDHGPASLRILVDGTFLRGAMGGTDERETGVEGGAGVEGVRGIVGDNIHHTSYSRAKQSVN